MNIIFYITAAIAILSTIMVITRKNGVHALLYLIVSFLSVATVFFTLGAPFMAALEVIIYAGAIMVLFVFVIMILNIGKEREAEEARLLKPSMWFGPSILALILLAELIYIYTPIGSTAIQYKVIEPQVVGKALFGPYVICVELSAMLLMAGIIGAYHIGKTKKKIIHRFLKEEEESHD